ncbi:Ectoine dioxygenase OS=Streptomyces fumanus OX=67302 GN=ectD PE=3 SV=1 [Streptomyces fumanus]
MTATTVTDLYPTRGATEVATPRQDPVVWVPPTRPDRSAPADLHAFSNATASSPWTS